MAPQLLVFVSLRPSPPLPPPSLQESTSVEYIGQVIVPLETLQAAPLQTFTATYHKNKYGRRYSSIQHAPVSVV